MNKNLDVTTFRNGDKIAEARSVEEWEEAFKQGKPAWCYEGFSKSNSKQFGRTYNWHAVKDERGLAPEGWHIPSSREWDELFEFVGENNSKKLRSKSGWGSNAGYNSVNFDLKPTQLSIHEKSGEISNHLEGFYWSTTTGGYRFPYNILITVDVEFAESSQAESKVPWAAAVRCLID